MNHKRKAFIAEYLKDFNATRAAIRAGYSDRSAAPIASRLLTFANIKEEIARILDERAMQSREIIDRLTDQGRGNLGDFIKITGLGYELDLKKAKKKNILHLVKRLKDRVVYSSKDGEESETHYI